MLRIPLNLQTLYADLAQSATFGTRLHGSISRRVVKGRAYLYVTEKHGQKRQQVFLGPADDAETMELADDIRRAASDARQRRATVSLLKRGGLTGPKLDSGRLLEALSNAGLFTNGLILVGTAAYQTYAPIVGYRLTASALTTQDADLAAASLAVSTDIEGTILLDVLTRADPTFRPALSLDRKALPKRFRTESGFEVDIITRFRSRNDEEMSVPLKSLGCSAEPLRYLEFLMEETLDVVALYNTGIIVRVPSPARYAVHKLIVAQERQATSPKRTKDLIQAKELIAALKTGDPGAIDDALEDAKSRGPKWRELIEKSLAEISNA